MKYDFLALKDIFEQVDEASIGVLAEEIDARARIFVYGAGRSGLMLRAFAMRLAQMGRTVYVVGETVTPAIEENDLLLIASASGKTESALRYAQIASRLGARVACITATAESALASCADAVICLPAPTKDTPDTRSIMGTLFEQAVLLFGDAVISALDTDPAQMRARHANLE